jgi:hypothetical protein
MYDVNYVAVFVAALANMVVGSLWYGPVFGKIWKGYMGLTEESMKKMPLSMWQALCGGFITALVMSYILAHVAVAFASIGVGGALQLGFWMWLGFAIPIVAGTYLWEGRPFGLFVLNASNWLVSLLLMSVVLVLWPM